MFDNICANAILSNHEFNSNDAILKAIREAWNTSSKNPVASP